MLERVRHVSTSQVGEVDDMVCKMKYQSDVMPQVCQDQAYLDTLAEGKRVPFSSVQSLYHVELKSSLRMRLAH